MKRPEKRPNFGLNQAQMQDWERQTVLSHSTSEGLVDDLAVQVENLGHLSETFKGRPDSTLVSFACTSKLSDFMAIKQECGLSVNENGKEVFFMPLSSRVLDIASARNQYYFVDSEGVFKVNSELERQSVTSIYPTCREFGVGRSLRPFLNKTSLLLTDSDQSVVAIFLNHKGDRQHVLTLSNNLQTDHKIVDLVTCDERVGHISSLFTLSWQGFLSSYKVSTNCRILWRATYPIPLPQNETCDYLAVSHDARYAAILVSKSTVLVLRVGGAKRSLKMLSVIELSTIPKNICWFGFYQISADVVQEEPQMGRLRFLYALTSDYYSQSKISFIKFNTRTSSLREVPGLEKDLPPRNPLKCVQNDEGGSWIVTSGIGSRYARLRIILDKSRRIAKNSGRRIQNSVLKDSISFV